MRNVSHELTILKLARLHVVINPARLYECFRADTGRPAIFKLTAPRTEQLIRYTGIGADTFEGCAVLAGAGSRPLLERRMT